MQVHPAKSRCTSSNNCSCCTQAAHNPCVWFREVNCQEIFASVIWPQNVKLCCLVSVGLQWSPCMHGLCWALLTSLISNARFPFVSWSFWSHWSLLVGLHGLCCSSWSLWSLHGRMVFLALLVRTHSSRNRLIAALLSSLLTGSSYPLPTSMSCSRLTTSLSFKLMVSAELIKLYIKFLGGINCKKIIEFSRKGGSIEPPKSATGTPWSCTLYTAP